MCEIADTIERDIARALQPKPEKVYENYWTIYEKDSFGSYHSYKDYISFASYEDAESFLLRDTTIVKAEQKYVDRQFFGDGVIFQSTTRYLSDTSTMRTSLASFLERGKLPSSPSSSQRTSRCSSPMEVVASSGTACTTKSWMR